MKTPENTQHKTGLSRKSGLKHKEPITTAIVGVLLILLISIFVFGVFMIRDYISATSQGIKYQDNANVPQNKAEVPELETSIVATRYTDGDRAFKPKVDMHYVVVDVDVVHRLDSPKWFSPVLETYITDASGNKYELSPVLLDRPFDAREYKINEHAKGELSYMVPKNSSNLSWCYEVSSLNLKSCSNL